MPLTSTADFEPKQPTKFADAVVVCFESRNGKEMARLVEKQQGRPLNAPSMREVPLSDQGEVFELGERLFAGAIDALFLLTGVGLRAMLDALSTRYAREAIIAELGKIPLICRGPKPQLVLKELGLKPAWVAPEPNTTETLLASLDQSGLTFLNKRVEIQEYGVRNVELARALVGLGAQVRSVAVYMWQLPEDTGPLEAAIREICALRVDVAMFTSAQQVAHLYQVAERLGLEVAMHSALRSRVVLASIGPVTTEALAARGLPPDVEPPHPKLGIFVTYVAAEWSRLRMLKPN